MITVNGIIVEYLGYTIPIVKIISRSGSSFYKTLIWPIGLSLTPATIKVEVANQWKVDPSEVVILENVEIPKI